ncbi:MAG TPA: hypothetical protein H9839_06070, partial [Candidatus Intestinimonas stercorigallinarum]|nr:hypothetical protein [Candidatus Intestinimonas stercorigallinarum]
QAADFFDFIEKVPDCTRKWGLTAPLSHFSPVAYFAWHHFFDSLRPSGDAGGPFHSLSKNLRKTARASQ